MERVDLKSLSIDELKELFKSIGEKEYRSIQTFSFIHGNMVTKISDITVLSKTLRDKLEKNYYISNLDIVERFDSKVDNTKKYLFLLEDGNIIESVVMEYNYGTTACISTQVGCRMGCAFCASTKEGLVRSLTPGEILGQVYGIQRDLDIKLSNLVLMGSGEPLDNYENVLKFLYLLHNEKGQNFSFRNITLSTCGIVPKIYELAEEELPITLSISLHSPFNQDRKKMMPIGKVYSIDEIIKACHYYFKKTNRRITFEYTLIKNKNDRKEDLEELSRILKGLNCHINLIPLNPIKEYKENKADNEVVTNFKTELEKRGINATIRREMGSDINAACGQLRRDYIKNRS